MCQPPLRVCTCGAIVSTPHNVHRSCHAAHSASRPCLTSISIMIRSEAPATMPELQLGFAVDQADHCAISVLQSVTKLTTMPVGAFCPPGSGKSAAPMEE